ncbi:DUF6125 family protein [Chloroflexota bacterium]
MKKLSDYSGEFLPELKLNDFSPDILADLLKLYSKLYIGLDGFWYLTVQERISNEEALACDKQAWDSASRYEMAKITKQLNIQGNDIPAYLKALQITPWFLNMTYQMEMKHNNSAVFTVTYCPTLYGLEKEGRGREDEICNQVCAKLYEQYAAFFNPAMGVKCLKSPPRKSKDEICCQWEINLEEKASIPQ